MWMSYTDLMPSQEDLERNFPWALRALLQTETPPPGELFVPGGPPASRELLVPFDYREDRKPSDPTIVLPDGMFREALEELKDGKAVCFMVDVHGAQKCQCHGRRHTRKCEMGRSVYHAVNRLYEDLQSRARVKLALMPTEAGDSPLMLNDHDGLGPPTVRFGIVPEEAHPDPEMG